MKTNKRKKNKTASRAIYSPLGRSLIVAGAAAMLICAIWECAVRLDSMDGILGAYFDLGRELGASLSYTLRSLFSHEEAVKDLSVVLYIASTGVFSVLAALFRKKTVACALMLPACVYILINDTGSASVLQALNLFRTIRAFCAVLILAGACLNIAYSVYGLFKNKKREQKREQKALESRGKQLSHGTYKTLIPQREAVQRSKSVRRNG